MVDFLLQAKGDHPSLLVGCKYLACNRVPSDSLHPHKLLDTTSLIVYSKLSLVQMHFYSVLSVYSSTYKRRSELGSNFLPIKTSLAHVFKSLIYFFRRTVFSAIRLQVYGLLKGFFFVNHDIWKHHSIHR